MAEHWAKEPYSQSPCQSSKKLLFLVISLKNINFLYTYLSLLYFYYYNNEYIHFKLKEMSYEDF